VGDRRAWGRVAAFRSRAICRLASVPQHDDPAIPWLHAADSGRDQPLPRNGRYWWVDALTQPLINFYRPLPPLAYYTLLVIWLGIGDASKIALLFLAAIPALVINTAAGVQAVRREMTNAALSLGANDWQVFCHVVYPATLPYIFTGMRIGLAFTYTTLVAAELVAATSGIGWMVLDASRFLRSDIIFMGVIIMGVTGMALDFIVVQLQRRFVPWLGFA